MFENIILTGSTGHIGTYLLHDLYERSGAKRIYCLNRRDEAQTRQETSLAERGLSISLPQPASSTAGPEIIFITANFDEPSLGLDEAVLGSLRSQTTAILHNAWPVDFNRHVTSFYPSLRTIAHLITFALSCSPHPASIFFVSSISAVGNWGALPGARLKVPEEEIEDWKVARLGYGQAKLLAEHILCRAASKSELPVTVLRVGQVAGPIQRGVKGCWPKQEWLPSLVLSSKHLGVLPATLGPMDVVDWVPVDVVAQVIGDLVTNGAPTSSSSAVVAPAVAPATGDGGKVMSKGTHRKKALFYHIVNPHTVAWNELLPTVTAALSFKSPESKEPGATSEKVIVVDFPSWVAALEASVVQTPGPSESASKATTARIGTGARTGSGTDSANDNPAVKLLPFFQTLRDKTVYLPKARAVILDTKNTRATSPTLAQLGSCTEAWVQLWLKQWHI